MQHQSIDLRSLIAESKKQQQDNTEYIRANPISALIRTEVAKMCELKEGKTVAEQNEESFIEQCCIACPYLFANQTAIFYRVFKNEFDISLLNKVLDALEQIETGQMSQHDASVNLGQMVADLYASSAVIAADRLDAERSVAAPPLLKPAHNLSYKQFKALNAYKTDAAERKQKAQVKAQDKAQHALPKKGLVTSFLEREKGLSRDTDN